MLEDERVALTAPGRGEQHRRADERVLSDEVEEMLEEPGERGPVDGTGDDEQVGGLDRAQRILDLGLQILAPQRAALSTMKSRR